MGEKTKTKQATLSIMRIATYNIHRAIGFDGNQDIERIYKILQSLDADIIALQEVNFETKECENVLQYWADRTQMTAIKGVTFKDQRGNFGNAILTRLPYLEYKLHDISKTGREPRLAIELELQIKHQKVQIIATHLGLKASERRQQIDYLLDKVCDSDAKIKILLGDLNEWFRWSRQLRRLRNFFGPIETPHTFPAIWPFLSLDRFWITSQSSIKSIQVPRSSTAKLASDHLPLLVEVEI